LGLDGGLDSSLVVIRSYEVRGCVIENYVVFIVSTRRSSSGFSGGIGVGGI